MGEVYSHDNQEFQFRDIVEAARDVIIVTKADPIDDPGPEIVYVNPEFTRVTGYKFEDVVGKSPRILQTDSTPHETRRKIKEALINHSSVRAVVKNRWKDGSEAWMELTIKPVKNDLGDVTHFVSIERDVTEQVLLQEQLDRLSKTDELTGLANRRAFYEALESEYIRYKRSDVEYTVLMFDIDFFKQVNDTYGHIAGDKVLKSLGELCGNVFRAQDIVARVGGEEFCTILPNTSKEKAYQTAIRFLESIRKMMIKFEQKIIRITVSIGIAEVDHEDIDSAEAVKRADNALYLAKDSGRDCIFIWRP